MNVTRAGKAPRVADSSPERVRGEGVGPPPVHQGQRGQLPGVPWRAVPRLRVGRCCGLLLWNVGLMWSCFGMLGWGCSCKRTPWSTWLAVKLLVGLLLLLLLSLLSLLLCCCYCNCCCRSITAPRTCCSRSLNARCPWVRCWRRSTQSRWDRKSMPFCSRYAPIVNEGGKGGVAIALALR